MKESDAAKRRKPAAWFIAVVVAIVVLAATVQLISRAKALRVITGAVLRQDMDFGKQLPVANAEVSLGDGLSDGTAVSDSSGFFRLKLHKGVLRDQQVTLQLRHPDYLPMDISEFLSDRLYVIRLVPKNTPADGSLKEPMYLSGIRVRYATRTPVAANAGSALKTFEVLNRRDVPCDRKGPCSPDGKWKAAIGGATLDAGENSSFHAVRVSCIAGPCPFTKVEKDSFSAGGRRIGVTVRNWSDTTTFLLEAEVSHITNSDVIQQSFPAIFDRSMSFTLPESAQGPSIEATLDGMDIVFPLGPTLALSWATCSVKVAGNGIKLYRCVLKPGYRFR